MDRDAIEAALDMKFESMDLGNITARGYLKRLLSDLLMQGERFSGKRPWGNSGWEHDLAKPLIMADAIKGSLDEDGYAEVEDDDEYEKALIALVEAL